EVVQEETLRRIAEAIGLPAAERVERREDALQLLCEGRLRHPAPSDAEQLDLAAQGRLRVLAERADDVVTRRQPGVRVEVPPRQADQVRGIQLGVLGVDRDE